MFQYVDNDSYLQQMQQEEEMHFYTCVMDVKDAFEYHGLPAIMHEVLKDPKFSKMFSAYLNSKVSV